jgi:hypothetical protein
MLYEWSDESGQIRYGSRPPPGVKARPASDRLDQLRKEGYWGSCRELLTAHLRLIDDELARVRKLSAGFGPEFEFTPEAKQQLINDLLIHRSALVSGRPPEDFVADRARELSELKMSHARELAQLRRDLEQQAGQLQRQQLELDRVRREAELTIQRYRSLYPGLPFYPR